MDELIKERTQEKTWECWTLSEEDITHVASDKKLSLENKDMDELARMIKKGIQNALGEWPWDMIVEHAIRNYEPREVLKI